MAQDDSSSSGGLFSSVARGISSLLSPTRSQTARDTTHLETSGSTATTRPSEPSPGPASSSRAPNSTLQSANFPSNDSRAPHVQTHQLPASVLLPHIAEATDGAAAADRDTTLPPLRSNQGTDSSPNLLTEETPDGSEEVDSDDRDFDRLLKMFEEQQLLLRVYGEDQIKLHSVLEQRTADITRLEQQLESLTGSSASSNAHPQVTDGHRSQPEVVQQPPATPSSRQTILPGALMQTTPIAQQPPATPSSRRTLLPGALMQTTPSTVAPQEAPVRELLAKTALAKLTSAMYTGPTGTLSFYEWKETLYETARILGCGEAMEEGAPTNASADRDLGILINSSVAGQASEYLRSLVRADPSGRAKLKVLEDQFRGPAAANYGDLSMRLRNRTFLPGDTVTSFLTSCVELYHHLEFYRPGAFTCYDVIEHIIVHTRHLSGLRVTREDWAKRLSTQTTVTTADLLTCMQDFQTSDRMSGLLDGTSNPINAGGSTSVAVHATSTAHTAVPNTAKGTNAANAPAKRSTDARQCTYCKSHHRRFRGHTVEECRTKKFEDAVAELSELKARLKGFETQSATKSAHATSSEQFSDGNRHSIMMDSSAAVSVVSDARLLDNIVPIAQDGNQPIIHGTGDSASNVTAQGRLTLTWLIDDITFVLHVNNVLLSPDAHVSIVNAKSLLRESDGTTSNKSQVILDDKPAWILRSGLRVPLHEHSDMFWLIPDFVGPQGANVKPPNPQTVTVEVLGTPPTSTNSRVHTAKILTNRKPPSVMSYEQFHRKLGHPSRHATLATAKRSNIELTGTDKVTPCHTCLLNKSTALSVDGKGHWAHDVGDLLHLDVWGPVRIAGLKGEKYAFCLRDHVSGWIEGRWISNLTDLVTALKEIVRDNRSGPQELRLNIGDHTILQWDSDPRGKSEVFKDYMSVEGFHFRASSPDTHAQNGAAEAIFNAVVPKVRALLNPAEEKPLPRTLWAHAFEHTVHLHNLTVTDRLAGVSAYEYLTGRAPELHHLRVFGCTAFVHQHDRRDKLDPTAIRGIYVGHNSVNDSATVYIPATHTTRDTVHVTFDEDESGVLPEGPLTTIKVPDSGEAEVPLNATPLNATDTTGSLTTTINAITPVVLVPVPPSVPDSGETEIPLNATENTGSLTTTTSATTPVSVPHSVPNSEKAEVPINATDDSLPTTTSTIKSRSGRVIKPNTRYERVHATFQQVMNTLAVDGLSSLEEEVNMDQTDVNADIEEPRTLREALDGPHSDMWMAAIETELATLNDLGAWLPMKRADVPSSKRILPCMFVFKIKRNKDGEIDKFKVRLTAKGNFQRPGLDFIDSSAPTAHAETFRTLLSVAAADHMVLKHVDIRAAFLQGELNESDEIYMTRPAFLELVRPDIGKEEVLRILRPIYGAHQSGNRWWMTLKNFLTGDLGMRSLEIDPCLFVGDGTLVNTHVDDMVCAGATEERAQWLVDQLLKRFEGSDLGTLSWYLGMRVTMSDDGTQHSISIRQDTFVKDMADRWGMGDAIGSETPFRRELLPVGSEPALDENMQSRYRQLVGELNYLSTMTRPDITTATSKLAQRLGKASQNDFNAAKDVVRYLRVTANYGITYRGDVHGHNNVLCLFVDASFGNKDQGRLSTTGAIGMLNNGPVCWTSKRQDYKMPLGEETETGDVRLPASSTCEAEVIACSASVKQVRALRTLLHGMGHPQLDPTIIFEDNQAAIHFANKPAISRSMRHLDIGDLLIRAAVETKMVRLEFCPGKQNLADGLTKMLDKALHQRFVSAVMDTAIPR